MKHPCEFVAKHILPSLRSLIAKGLIEDHGFSQTAAAEKIGTTQAAISYYLSLRRGEKFLTRLESDPLIKSTIEEIINGLATGSLSSEEVMDKLCDLCMSLRKSEKLNNLLAS